MASLMKHLSNFRAERNAQKEKRERRKVLSRTLKLETLQSRQLLAVDVGYDAAVKAMVITGTSGDDQVEVSWVKNSATDFDDQLVVKDHGKVIAAQNVWNAGEPLASPTSSLMAEMGMTHST